MTAPTTPTAATAPHERVYVTALWAGDVIIHADGSTDTVLRGARRRPRGAGFTVKVDGGRTLRFDHDELLEVRGSLPTSGRQA